MRRVTLATPTDFSGWRSAARCLLAERTAPEDVTWIIADAPDSLFAGEAAAFEVAANPSSFTVPNAFLWAATAATLHSDVARFGLLYRLLWRLQSEPRLMSFAMDGDVCRVNAMAAAVRRDIHKMHAFLRFRQVKSEPPGFIAWFEPEHHILAAAAGFFVERFANVDWVILTPQRRAIWDGRTLRFDRGGSRRDVPAKDAAEDLWLRYYGSIFNPARLNTSAMRSHMPRKFWRNLPEAQLIPQLVEDAHARMLAMIDKAPATERRERRRPGNAISRDQRPERSLRSLRESALTCHACPLWRNATQTVFGEGPSDAKIVFIGEQPGDQEDLTGQPFVGPAGRLFDRALLQAGIDRSATYITNAVKHFKFEPRGKRRLHKKPNEVEIAACHQWLAREVELLTPALIVVLGATAARSVFGRATPIEKNRGRILEPAAHNTDWPADILVTVHPSFLLRVPDADQAAAFEKFVADLALAKRYQSN